MRNLRILALCGSLKSESSNKKILQAAQKLATSNLQITLFEGIGDIPHYSPDIDIDPSPLAVQKFRQLLQSSNAILISSPEYAHGIPGAFKNALDWSVSSGEFDRKPVVLINASTTGGEFARPQLIEVLKAMGAQVLQTASMQTPVMRKAFDSQGELIDPQVIQAIKEALQTLQEALS